MNNKAIAILFALTLSSFASYCYSQNTQLLEYAAEYEASANGLAATATRSLRRIDENSYRLSNSLEASLAGQTLANLDQASEFIIDGNQVVPLNYTYQLSGVSRASHAIFFNWDADVALSTEGDESWQLQLNEGVMDQLSYQLAIRLALIDNTEIDTTFSFEVVDGDAIEMQEYHLVGEEIISTPLGELSTLKLERVREASDERVTEIWLALEWDFLLTRIEQINSSGLRISLELKSAELDGNTVRGIN
ncbi:MAG: hypothetical protein COB20_16320 [SAR86 cluster bacterium]|uniref:DUF3108 domain-containing protein n=1 Tax=SAR86 cluster bacterium TaxID=2030880 RepID=A0A2A4WTH8_9GAMM|nr:MAG: hypothetical protein COB20_16320 [SAR86 cluster bacterium]